MSELNILIATHNGSDVLGRTLEGYVALNIQDIDYRLIIVDNASTDDTQMIIHSFCERLPISLLYEPNLGKNKAMNAGLQVLDAEIVIMSDDDAVPHAAFARSWVHAFAEMPEIDLFGGSILPVFDVAPPDWMLAQKPRFEELYAHRENIPAGPISPDRIYGPNMAVRGRVIRSGLAFDARIGPDASRKQSYAMGSETAFLREAVAAGFKTGFAPAPTVSHIVRARHVEPDYIDARAYRMGRGTAFKHCQDGTFTLRDRPFPVRLAGGAKRTLDYQLKRLRTRFGSHETRFHARWDANFYRGYHDEISDQKAYKRAATI